MGAREPRTDEQLQALSWTATEGRRYAALAELSQALADVDDLDELGRVYHDRIERVLSLPMGAIYLFGQDSRSPSWTTSYGVSERFMSTYERIGRPVDLELREVLRTAAPVYNLSFRTVEQWRSSDVYQLASRLESMAHVIKAPVVVDGAIIGTIDFASSVEDPIVTPVEVDLAAALATVVGGAVRALRRRQRIEVDLSVVRAALESSTVAVVWFDPDTNRPHVTPAAADLVRELQEGEDILYRVLRDVEPDSGRTTRSYLVRLTDGTKDVLTCRVRPVPGHPGAETMELSLESARTGTSSPLLEGLSAREVEVASLVAAGYADQEIADELVLSLYTVRQHVKNIYLKLGISGRVQLTRVFLGRSPRAH